MIRMNCRAVQRITASFVSMDIQAVPYRMIFILLVSESAVFAYRLIQQFRVRAHVVQQF